MQFENGISPGRSLQCPLKAHVAHESIERRVNQNEMGSDRLINLPKSREKKGRNKLEHLPHESGQFNLSSIQNLILSLTPYRIRKLEVILFYKY